MPATPNARPTIAPGQIRLLDLLGVVLVAAVAARLLIGINISSNWAADRGDRVLGAILVALATLLGGRLTRELCVEPVGRRRRWAISWRLAGLVALAALAAEECRWLQVGDERLIEWSRWVRPACSIAEVRLGLLPTALATLMVGLCCGRRPIEPGASRTPPRGRSIAAGVVATGVIALLLIVVETGFLGYLVLLALHGVRNAHVGIPALKSTLFFRLDRVAGLSLIAAASTLWTASLIALDARRPRPPSRRSIALRAAAMASTVLLAGTLATVGFTTLDPYFACGLRDRLGLAEFAVVAVAFFGLTAGLAARSVDPSPTVRPISARARAARLAAGAIVTIGFIGTVGENFAHLSVLPGWLQGPIDGIFGLQSNIRVALSVVNLTNAIWTVVLGGLAIQIVFTPLGQGQSPAPLDALGDRLAPRGRFLWISLGLTAVCLAALPTLALGGMALTHLLIGSID